MQTDIYGSLVILHSAFVANLCLSPVMAQKHSVEYDSDTFDELDDSVSIPSPKKANKETVFDSPGSKGKGKDKGSRSCAS